MSAVEGTVHFDTPSSVTPRLKKRDIVHVTGSSQGGDTALIPRPTGSEVKRMVAEGALEAHPFFSSMTAAKLSSRICRIAAPLLVFAVHSFAAASILQSDSGDESADSKHHGWDTSIAPHAPC